MINSTARRAILKHANDEYPRESCGVLVDGNYIPCANISKLDDQFRMDPKDLVAAKNLGKIQAYVHSHPDGSTDASVPDRIQMGFQSKPWIITNGIGLATHQPEPFAAKLLGRDYYHGLLDCYTLIRDYYNRELNIQLNDYHREDAWWEDAKSNPLYLDNFAKEGFVEVSDIQQHDIILCRLGRTEHVNHGVIFIGDGELQSEPTTKAVGNELILHHPYGRQSVREIYGEQWQRRAAVIIRHQSLL